MHSRVATGAVSLWSATDCFEAPFVMGRWIMLWDMVIMSNNLGRTTCKDAITICYNIGRNCYGNNSKQSSTFGPWFVLAFFLQQGSWWAGDFNRHFNCMNFRYVNKSSRGLPVYLYEGNLHSSSIIQSVPSRKHICLNVFSDMTFAIGMDDILFLQCPLSIWLHTTRILGSSANRSQSTKHLSSRGTGRLSSATAPSQCTVL